MDKRPFSGVEIILVLVLIVCFGLLISVPFYLKEKNIPAKPAPSTPLEPQSRQEPQAKPLIAPENKSTAGIVPGKRFSITLKNPAVFEKYKMKFRLLEVKGDTCLIDISFSGKDDYGEKNIMIQPQIRENKPVWMPNANNYPDYGQTSVKPVTLYRRVKNCADDQHCQPHKPNQVIALDDPKRPYKNYICRPRYYEQCILDGSFDCYYEEYCDYEPVWFKKGESKDIHILSLMLVDIRNNKATLVVSNNKAWKPELEPGWKAKQQPQPLVDFDVPPVIEN